MLSRYCFQMSPTFYGPRKTNRASWTQENLDKALKDLQNKNASIRDIALKNNIPEKTLRTRIKENNFIKGNLGKKSHLGEEMEKKLVEHVIKLQSVGFAPSRKNLRKLTFNLSQKLGLKQVFNIEKKIAGKGWYRSFMRRNPTLSIRKPRGTSNARANAMNKEDIKNYFDLLKQCLNDNNLMNKPSNIYNMDESGLQLNNEPDVVVALKGSRNVQIRQCAERGETITIVTCCNAEGSFLPPYCIFKGIRKQETWDMNMPPGSVIKMRKESAYINEDLFMDWLENHFIPRKSPGQCLLILDGHGSQTNSPDMLQMAVDNDVHILCLPSHTTHYLQPLDRAFFKPLKTYFRDAACEWGNANPTKKIGRIHFGLLLTKAWSQAATIQTGISGFRATGIYPFCPSAIPEYAYLQSAIQHEESSESDKEMSLPIITNSSSTHCQTCIMTDESKVGYLTLNESQAQPGPSNMNQQPPLLAETPTTKTYQVPVRRILKEISPIPKTDHLHQENNKLH
ncbi:jerky protein homolog-like isoform X1 [Solenopsis invicta]|uniref:jerky protein homolog-like isoform X1 n=2 Tax=Solenopsis invicta TaxID=13686 RepID=UPI00193D152C|nr:jerky protein homolog-like isoform X1 [Solenopsis invicta]